MTGAELAAVITAAAGLVAAVTALVRALRVSQDLKKHVIKQAIIASRAAQQTGPGSAACK